MSVDGNVQTEYASLSGKIHTLVIDKTLSISGAAADAKATGAAMEKLEEKVDDAVEAAEEAYKNAEEAFENAAADVEKTIEESLEEFAEGLSKFSEAAFLRLTSARTKINTFGDVPVGCVLTFNVGGASKEFIVVHHGKPGDIYADNCDGTWLMMKELLYTAEELGSDYATCPRHTYLNGSYYNSLEDTLRNAIKTVNIPYVAGMGTSGVLHTGAGGLETKVFSPSRDELDISASSSYFTDGAPLTYFDTTGASGRSLKDSSGTHRKYIVRTPRKDDNSWASVSTSGGSDSSYGPTFKDLYYPAMFIADSAADLSGKSLYTDGATLYDYGLYGIEDINGEEKILDCGRVEVVSYIGTGDSVGGSSSTPCSVTFSFAPKFLWWFDSRGRQFTDSTTSKTPWFFLAAALPKWESASTNNSPLSNVVLGTQDEGRTVKWYWNPGGSGFSSYMPVYPGSTYYVLAIG